MHATTLLFRAIKKAPYSLRYILIPLLLSAISIRVAGQKTDLKNVAPLLTKLSKTKVDTSKVNILIDLSVALQGQESEKSLDFANKALGLSKKVYWVTGQCKSYNRIGRLYFDRSYISGSIKSYQKMFNLAKELGDYYYQTLALQNLAFVYAVKMPQGHQKAIEYRLLSLHLSKGQKDDLGTMETLMPMGEDYAFLENYEKALRCWTEAVVIRERLSTKGFPEVYGNIGLAHKMLGDYARAEQALTRAVRQMYAEKDTIHELQALTNLLVLYVEHANTSAAQKTVGRVLLINTARKDEHMNASFLNSVGREYGERGDYKNAVFYKLQSLQKSESIHDKTLVATTYNDLSMDYVRLGDHDKAQVVLLQAVQLFTELGDFPTLAKVYANLAVVHAQKGNKDSAETYRKLSIHSAANRNDTDATVSIFLGEETKALQEKDFKKAFSLSLQVLAMAKSNSDEDKARKADFMATVARDYLVIVMSGKAGQLPDSIQHRSKQGHLAAITRLLDSAIMIDTSLHLLDLLQQHQMFLSMAYEYGGDYRKALEHHKLFQLYHDSVFNNRKTKEIAKIEYDAEKQKDKLLMEKRELEESLGHRLELSRKENVIRLTVTASAALLITVAIFFYYRRKREKIKFLEQITSVRQEALNAQMSDHFIGNTMDSINNFIQENDKEKAGKYLILFSRLIRRVLENASEKLIPLKEDLEILNDYIGLEKLRFEDGKLDYQLLVDRKKVDLEDTMIPPMVFQVLAENAIKHGFEKTKGGKLSVEIVREDESIRCTVTDNGVGRAAAKAIYDMPGRVSFGGSLAERLIKSTDKHFKAASFKTIDLFNQNNEPAGTQVAFTFPYIPS